MATVGLKIRLEAMEIRRTPTVHQAGRMTRMICGFILYSLFMFGVKGEHVHEMQMPFVNEISWKNCNTSAPVLVKSLDITPNPIQFGSNLDVAVDVLVKEQLSQGLSANVDLKMKQGETYVSICNMIGPKNCQLPDVCSAMKTFAPKCPESLKQKKFDCTCPIPKNDYNVSKMTFPIPDIHFGIEGSFEAIVHVLQKGDEVACLDLKFCLVACQK